MKNTRDFILALSIIINMGAFVTISKQYEQINSLVERSDYYERKSLTKKVEEKIEESPIDTLDLIMNVWGGLIHSTSCIESHQYDMYKKNAPEVIKNLERIISFTKDENNLKILNNVKKIVEGNPTEEEIRKTINEISLYYHTYKKDSENRREKKLILKAVYHILMR